MMNKLKINNGLGVSGTLRLSIYDIEGRLIKKLKGHNLVVNSGLAFVARSIGGDHTKSINRVAVGTGSDFAKSTDTSLTEAQFFSLEDFLPSYYNTNVVFRFVIDYAQAVGTTITEFGLVLSDDALFSRKVVEPIEKTSTIRIVGDWTINLAAPAEEPGSLSYDFSNDFN